MFSGCGGEPVDRETNATDTFGTDASGADGAEVDVESDIRDTSALDAPDAAADAEHDVTDVAGDVEQEAEVGEEPDAPTNVPDIAESFIDGRECPPDSQLTWENFGRGFLLARCTGCHSDQLPEGQRAGAPVGVDLNTRTHVDLWLERIYARSADENLTMPPVDSVNDAEVRRRLGDWLACGAP